MRRPADQDADAEASAHPTHPTRATPQPMVVPSSLGRALRLLETFSAEAPVLSVRELARRSGVSRSTTHRLVCELTEWGALERTTAGVRLGMRLFELGTLVAAPLSFREVALPYAHNLNEITGLTVNLAIRSGHEIVYLEKITSRTLRVPHSRMGGRGALHATALGKAMLAFSGPEIVHPVLDSTLERYTAHTLTDPGDLLRELAEIVKRRVAFDREETRAGLFCVAAPVLDRHDRPIGAISVTGASTGTVAEHYAPATRTTARAIGHALSGAKPSSHRMHEDHPRPGDR